MTSIDIAALAAQAAATSADMGVAQSGGGGDYTPPAEGMVRLRLVGYFELGKHEEEYQGVKKIKDKVQLVFELSGPKHKPAQTDNGPVPLRMTITETLSLNEKAGFFKLFNLMNYDGAAKHMAQLVGKDFIGTIFHKKSKDGTKTYANLKDANGYSIRRPFVPNPETGEDIRIHADPAITPLKLFIWNLANKAMWDSIFIDGEYPQRTDEKTGVVYPAKSKNVIQNKIKSALNFEGSPASQFVVADLGLEEPTKVERSEAAVQASVEAAAVAKAGTANADPLEAF